MNNHRLDTLLRVALEEDIGEGDHSTLGTIPAEARGKAQLFIKEEGILSGVEVVDRLFRLFDPELSLEVFIHEGEPVHPGDVAFRLDGRQRSILGCERTALNILQRMSGIATQTHRYVKKLEGLKTRVLDTRKTTPGFRILEKMAVKTGGGENHRMGLYDMVMLKDNHIDFAGGIEQAIRKTRKYLEEKHKDLKIEIEARNLADVKEILRVGGVDVILLDNFSPALTRKAVGLIRGRYFVESSGGINLENIRAYAECGVDFVSVGALTHRIHSLDMSLKAC